MGMTDESETKSVSEDENGHEGGTPLSCWVERSKPRYKGPSLIFYYVFLAQSLEDSFRQVQTMQRLISSLQIDRNTRHM